MVAQALRRASSILPAIETATRILSKRFHASWTTMCSAALFTTVAYSSSNSKPTANNLTNETGFVVDLVASIVELDKELPANP